MSKQLLIEQIINNFQGSLIEFTPMVQQVGYVNNTGRALCDYYYAITFTINGIPVLQIGECDCKHANRLVGNYRKDLEDSIVQHIVNQHKSFEDKIKIVNLGNDWPGILRILAMLYKIGYRNFAINNICENQDLISQKYNRIENLEFWQDLFEGARFTINVVGIEPAKENFFAYLKEFEDFSGMIIFAEDLISKKTRYRITYTNQSICNVAHQVMRDIPTIDKIFCVDAYYGNITELNSNQDIDVGDFGKICVTSKTEEHATANSTDLASSSRDKKFALRLSNGNI